MQKKAISIKRTKDVVLCFTKILKVQEKYKKGL